MKYIRQFLFILFISFVGELLHTLLPLPVPASVYGFGLLLVGLITGVIPLSSVKETGKFLIEIMPIMFIPAGVGLLDSWNLLAPVWLPIAVITIVSTIVVMAVSGRITQFMIRKEAKNK